MSRVRTISSVLKLSGLFIFTVMLPAMLYPQDSSYQVNYAYDLFNERGYLKSGSYSSDGQLTINTFNGNLMYSKRLEYILTTMNGLHQELTLVYNGSVSHIIPSGYYEHQSCYTRDNGFSAPEWILSLNGFALQVFDFENEVSNLVDYPDSCALYNGVSLLVPGYHSCRRFDQTLLRWEVSLLREDGSVQVFHCIQQGAQVDSTLFLTLDKDDQSKVRYNPSASAAGLDVYRADGSILHYIRYFPRWNTMIESAETRKVIFLPAEFTDRFGNKISVEYDTTFTDGSKIYGRPLLRRVGDFYFHWGSLRTKGSGGSILRITTSDQDTIYTIEYGNCEDAANPGIVSAQIGGDRNRALVTSISDKAGRCEYFSYLPYYREGIKIAPHAQVIVIDGERINTAKEFRVKPARLVQYQNAAGGITGFTYLNDSMSRWRSEAPLNNPMVPPVDSLVVDYNCSKVSGSCGTYDHSPCFRSDCFIEYGRDPYFLNMVTAQVRYDGYSIDTGIVSHDTMIYSWKDADDDYTNYISASDTLWTTALHTTSGIIGGQLPERHKEIFTFEQTCRQIGYYPGPYDYDWIPKLNCYESYRGDTTEPHVFWILEKREKNYWHGAGAKQLLLDSTRIFLDGGSSVTRYDYRYVQGASHLYLLQDTMVNIIRKDEIDPYGVTTSRFYNQDYFNATCPPGYYSNALMDSVVVRKEDTLLAKTYSEYYDGVEPGGYVGQQKTSSSVILVSGEALDAITSNYSYYVDAVRPMDNGAPKREISPEGDIIDYFSMEIAADTTSPEDSVDGARIVCHSPGIVKDTVIVSGLGTLVGNARYGLDIAESSGHTGTWAEIRLNGTTVRRIAEYTDYNTGGEIPVREADTVELLAQVSLHDTGVNPAASASVVVSRYADTLFNPVRYLKTDNDGTVDVVDTEFSYNGPFWATKIARTDADSVVYHRLVDDFGLLRKGVDPNGQLAEFTYDGIHRVRNVVLPFSFGNPLCDNCRTVWFEYDDTPIQRMLGARTRIYSQIADSEAVKTTYFTFDGLYRNFLATQLGGDGNADSNRTVFDLRNRPAVSIDQLGYATSNRYDNLDRVVATIFPDSVSPEQISMESSYDAVSFAGDLPYYPFSRPGENPYLWTTSTIDENGHKQNEYKDARGQTRALRQYTGAMPYCTSYATTYFGYDNLGNLTDVQRPNGDQVHYQYNSLGWKMKEWAADYDTVTYTRDRKGRLTGVKDGELHLLDDDTLSHWKYIAYDPLDRIMETGVLVTRGSDTVSQTPISQFFYDQDNARNSEGRLSVSLSNDNGYEYGERYNYDARGRLTEQTNYFGADLDSTKVDSIYVSLKRETGSCREELIVDKDTDVQYRLVRVASQYPFTRLVLEKNDTLVTETYCPPASDTLSGTIACHARDTITLSAWIFPSVDSQWTSLYGVASYERFERPQKYLKAITAYRIAYTYNQADQVTSITYPDGMSVTYGYDDRGCLARVGDSHNPARYARLTYTRRDELDTLILGPGELSGENDLQTVNYAYNARGWLNAINNGSAGTAAPGDLFGERLYYYGYPNKPWQPYYNGNILVQRLSFAGDAPGTLKESHYQYDDLDRLSMAESFDSESHPLVDSLYEEFIYDGNSNFRKRYIGRNVVSSTYFDSLIYAYHQGTNQVSRVTSESGAGIIYDRCGNMKYDSSRGIEFRYDIYNQLDTALIPGASGTSYVAFGYNMDGRRVYKDYQYWYLAPCDDIPIPKKRLLGPDAGDSTASASVPGAESDKSMAKGDKGVSGGGGELCRYHSSVITQYILERQGGKVLAEYTNDPERPCRFKFIYAGDQRIAMYDQNGRLHFYLNDHLGSARVMIDSSGTVKDKYLRYYAFGSTAKQTVSTNQPYRYTGKPFDDESTFDLYYYGARYYDPRLGRFIAIDPLTDKSPSVSPYVYALDNPLTFRDPSGKWFETFLDIASTILSAKDFWNEPSWKNAGLLLVDVGCTFAPFIPAVGIVRHAGKLSNIFKTVDKGTDAAKAMKRGLDDEKIVLDALGFEKNTKKLAGFDQKMGLEGTTVPDVVRPSGQTIDIKSRQYLSDSKQLRLQSDISAKAGQKAQIITVGETKVSETVNKRMDVRSFEEMKPKE